MKYSPLTEALADRLMRGNLFPPIEEQKFYRLTFFKKDIRLITLSIFDNCPIKELKNINPPIDSLDPFPYMGKLYLHMECKYKASKYLSRTIINHYIKENSDKTLLEVKKGVSSLIKKQFPDQIPMCAMLFHLLILEHSVKPEEYTPPGKIENIKNNTNSNDDRDAVSTLDRDTPLLVMYISSCANMMIAGEVNYLRSIGKFDSVFDKSKAGDYVLERITLISSFLSIYKIKIKDGWDRFWLKEISTNYDTSKTITDNNIEFLFDERIGFYSDELDVMKRTSTPLPNVIISQLYRPMVAGSISHKISAMNGFTIQENMMLWKIITTEIDKMMEKVQKNKKFIYSSPNNP